MSIASILAFLGQIISQITGSSSAISSTISLLTQIIGLIDTEITTLAPEIKNIIAALSNSSTVTADQLAQLSALNAQVDAAFDAAAADAGVPPDTTAGS